MTLRFVLSMWILICTTSCLTKNKTVVIEPVKLKNDWISKDSKFMIIEDTIICSNFLGLHNPVSTYTLSNDTLKVTSEGDPRFNRVNSTHFKIEHHDSSILIIRNITNQDTIGIYFTRLNTRKNNLKFKSLEFSSSPCFGTCPVLDLKITDDSTLLFKGYNFVKHKGFYTHKLSAPEFGRLMHKIHALDLTNFNLPPTPPDAPNMSLFIKSGHDSIQTAGTLDHTINSPLPMLIIYLVSFDQILNLTNSKDPVVHFKNSFNQKWFKTDN